MSTIPCPRCGGLFPSIEAFNNHRHAEEGEAVSTSTAAPTPTPPPPQTPPEEGMEGKECVCDATPRPNGTLAHANDCPQHSPEAETKTVKGTLRVINCPICPASHFSCEREALEHVRVSHQISPPPLAQTLQERGERYGDFETECTLNQNIMTAFEHSKNWRNLPALQKHALTMIAMKITRVLNGDADYPDNFRDIAGYAALAERSLGGGKG